MMPCMAAFIAPMAIGAHMAIVITAAKKHDARRRRSDDDTAAANVANTASQD